MWSRIVGWFRRHRRANSDTSPTDDLVADRNLVLGMAPHRIPNTKQLGFLPKLLNQKERNLLRIFFSTAIICALVLIGNLLAKHIRAIPNAGGSLSEGFVGTPQLINPVLARDQTVDDELTRLLFPGLLKLDENMQLVPDLAESFSVSDDKKTYTIKLKPNLKWSDGESLTSADVAFTVTLIRDSSYASPSQYMFEKATVETPDDLTIVFKLSQAQTAFPYYLTTGFLPEHSWADIEADPRAMPTAELNVKPVSSGPYKYHSLTKDRNGVIRTITLTRNKNYSGGATYLNRYIIKFYPDKDSAVDALKNESIDLLGNIDTDTDQQLNKKFVRTSIPTNQIRAVFFNGKKSAILNTKEIRRALNLAVNRADIVSQIYSGHATAIGSPVLAGYPGYDPTLMPQNYNPDQANSILENAGWKKNDQGIRVKNKQTLQFTLTVPDNTTYVQIAEALVKKWQEIGVRVNLNKVDPVSIQREVIKSRNYEALLFGHITDASGDLYSFWHSSQQNDTGYNLSIFYNRQIDQDLEKVHAGTDATKTAELYRDLQKQMSSDTPAIFLVQLSDVMVHAKKVRGLDLERLATVSDRFGFINNWYVQTKLSWH